MFGMNCKTDSKSTFVSIFARLIHAFSAFAIRTFFTSPFNFCLLRFLNEYGAVSLFLALICFFAIMFIKGKTYTCR